MIGKRVFGEFWAMGGFLIGLVRDCDFFVDEGRHHDQEFHQLIINFRGLEE
jgi:hypothetical protein